MSRYRFVEAESRRYPVVRVCRIVQVSRAAYYAWKEQPVSARAHANAALTAKIRAIHTASDGQYGVPRVRPELHAQGEAVGRKRVARLMKAAGLRGRRPPRWVRTTTPASTPCTIPDRVHGNITASARAGHRKRRRPQTRRQRARANPMSIAHARCAHPRRLRGPQRRVELLCYQLFDRLPNPFPHHPSDRIAPERFHFSAFRDPAIASHGVILRRPLPGGRELWINSPENDAFFLFHQSTDTTAGDTTAVRSPRHRHVPEKRLRGESRYGLLASM
jgi:hypothetical protein